MKNLWRMTSIIFVCWRREHSAMLFVEMNICERNRMLLISKINWDKNYCDQKIREILEHITSISIK